MRYKLDPNRNHEPAYLQLYYLLKQDIIAGIYPFQSKLPSKRTLAIETGTSVITVEHTYAMLCDEGYVESRERSGYFVIFHIEDGFLSTSPQNSISIPHFSQDENHKSNMDFPFSVLTKTMRKVISHYDEYILNKSPNAGCLELRKVLKHYLYTSRDISTDIEQIIIGAGAEYLYSLLIPLLGRDKIYGIETPSYQQIEQVYQSSQVSYEKLPLGIDGIDSSHLWNSNANILHITPYRSFPSNITATASKRFEYLHWAKERNGIVIEDDFESEFSISKKTEDTLYSLSSDENVIYLNTFSKTISPSLRVGYMVLPKSLVPIFEEKLGFYSCTVPTYIQLVLAELISNGDFERHINRVRRQKRKECVEKSSK